MKPKRPSGPGGWVPGMKPDVNQFTGGMCYSYTNVLPPILSIIRILNQQVLQSSLKALNLVPPIHFQLKTQ